MNNQRFKNILFAYVLFVATVLVHFKVLLNEIVNWHDTNLFELLRSVANGSVTIAEQNSVAPAVLVWYGLQYTVGGEGYFIYHAMSLLLHSVNALLVFFLMLRFGASAMAAMTASFLFAIHPMHIETLAVVSNQTTLVSMLLLQLTILFISLSRDRNSQLYTSITFFIVAMYFLIGNPSVLVIVAIMLVLHSQRRDISWNSMKPFVLLWCAAIVVTVWNQQFIPYLWSLVNGTLLMLRYGIVDQLFRFVFPWNAPLLPETILEYQQNQGIGSMLYPLIVLFIAVGAFAVRTRIPMLKYAVIIGIAGSLPLFTGIDRKEWVFNDDGAYLSSLGWILLFAWCMEQFVLRFQDRKGIKFALNGFMIAVLLMLSMHSVIKTSYWFNGETFWKQVIQEKPTNIFAHIKKGMFHFSRYEIDDALRALDDAVSLAPENFETNYTRGLINLGAMLLPAATKDYTKALSLDTASSNAYFGLGAIHSLYSRNDSAVIAYSMAIHYNPAFYEAYTNRGTVYGTMGKFAEAYADFRKAQEIRPKFNQIYGNRALVSLMAGNAQAAILDFNKQIELEPKMIQPRIHSAFTALLLGDTAQAILQFSKSNTIDSVRTKIYLSTVFPTFLKTKKEIEAGKKILMQTIGHK